jgi:hypothetical protein
MKAEAEELIGAENCVALFAPIIRAYLSPCWCCKYCNYDCKGNIPVKSFLKDNIRGPCKKRQT